jgi:hypothetical protein
MTEYYRKACIVLLLANELGAFSLRGLGAAGLRNASSVIRSARHVEGVCFVVVEYRK